MMSHDHMKQASTPLWWSLRITRKTYDARTESGGNKTKTYLPKTAYQSEFTGRGRLCHSNSLLWFLPLLSQLTVTTKKLWEKKNGAEQGLKNQQKMITESLERKK